MSSTLVTDVQPPSFLKRLRRDEEGATAVEFALIAVPFIMLLFGIISVCLYFFTQLYMEAAVYNAARDIRTGAYTEKTGSYVGMDTEAQRREKFKELVCQRTPNASDCSTNLRVIIAGYTPSATVTKPDCLSGGSLISDSSSTAVGADQPVLITACYEWKFGGQLPFFKIGNMGNGSRLITINTTLRTEPFN
jgi:Flp pilus assembly protein TadG